MRCVRCGFWARCNRRVLRLAVQAAAAAMMLGDGVAGGGADAHVSRCDIGWFDSGRWGGGAVDRLCSWGPSMVLDWLFVRLFLSCVWVELRLTTAQTVQVWRRQPVDNPFVETRIAFASLKTQNALRRPLVLSYFCN